MPKQVTELEGTCTFSYKTNKQTNKKSPKSVVTVVGGAVPARQTWRESPVMLTVGVLSGCVHPLCLATVNGSGRLATLQALTTRQENDRGASRVLWRTGVRTPRTPARTVLLSADSVLTFHCSQLLPISLLYPPPYPPPPPLPVCVRDARLLTHGPAARFQLRLSLSPKGMTTVP